MEKKPAGPNPGLIWCNSKVTKPHDFGRNSFCHWYSDIHIPDVLKTGAVREAYRYLAIDPDEEFFHMTLYYVDDVEGLYDRIKCTMPLYSAVNIISADCFKAVPLHHESIPGSHDMFDYGYFDTRFYKTVQVYEREQSKSSQPDLLLSTELLPADEQDFENWYRQEHLVDGSKIGGWRCTERYELVDALRTHDAPKYLTLLFLDGDSVPMKDLEKAGGSPWTRRMVGSMKKMRTGMYQRSTHHTQNNKTGASAVLSSL